MRACRMVLAALLLAALGSLVVPSPRAAETGRIIGAVHDAESGEALIGFSVYLEGTTTGAKTDMDGRYVIKNITPGTYTLIVSGIGFQQYKVTELTIAAGVDQTMDFALERQTVQTDSIVVVGKLHRDNQASMLKHRQKADFVGDAVSADEISRAGAGDAASAMERVVGASVVGGKYVYVRGLGDRYANTQLNGSPLPSPDPDKQAVQMDLIPSGLLDNIVVQKTFTPDKPGNFTGGSVNMTTKYLPDGRTLSFSTSTSYNSLVTFNDNLPTSTSGSKDWLGYDDGTRGLPEYLSDTGLAIPNVNRIRQLLNKTAYPDSVAEGKRLAAVYDDAAEALSTEMSPKTRDVPLNQSYAFNYGDRFQLFDKPLGVQGSLTYSRTFSMYEGGQVSRFRLPTTGSTELAADMSLSDTRGVEEVHWGGLLSFAYQIHPRHRIRYDFMHNQSGESSARYMIGEFGEQQITFENNQALETRVLEYAERRLSTHQILGSHDVKVGLPLRAEWQYSSANTQQDEPDVRMFTNDFLVQNDSLGNPDTVYFIQSNLYRLPDHRYRELEETSRDGRLDLLFRFQENQPAAGSFKTGMAFSDKERTFRESGFSISPKSRLYYSGDPDWFFSPDNMGMVESQSNLDSTRPVFVNGNSITPATEDKNNYDAEQKVWAWYGMVEFPLFDRIQVITGARYENTEMDLSQPFVAPVKQDSAVTEEKLIDEGEWLPSLNVRYSFSGNVNLRAGVSRTIARPTMRELAPYTNEEYRGGYLFTGNPDLEYTTVTNWDLRWEYFTGPGEVLSASLFYKKLKNPIELAIITENGEMKPQNVDEAGVVGVEFEWRQSVGRLYRGLSNFSLGGNLTFVHSAVDIPEFELNNIRAFDPGAEDTRPLQGQSPYIVNLDLNYGVERYGFQATLLYNVFGERFIINGKGGTPDVYEQPRHMVDFTAQKRILGGAQLKLGVENILDEKVEMTQEFLGKDYYYRLYETGTTYKIGLSVSL